MGVAIAVNIAVMGLGMIPTVMSSVYFNSINFIAGGYHTPDYNADAGQGVGYFRGGSDTDLPDVYFIATPYISGEIVWVEEEEGEGRFVMRNCASQAVKIQKYDTTITYNDTNLTRMMFKIILADGTVLIFDEIDAASNHSSSHMNKRVRGDGDDCDEDDACRAHFGSSTNELTTLQWHLTKVLKSGYADGSATPDEDPLNSIGENTGSWIAFHYNTLEFPDRYFDQARKQTGPYTLGDYYMGAAPDKNGQGARLNFLTDVITPNESAEFIYPTPYDRVDKRWSNKDNKFDYAMEPRLAEIQFKNAEGALKKKATFNQDYHLKIRDCHEQRGSLTLNSITIWDNAANKMLPPVLFEYENRNPTLDVTCQPFGWNWRSIDGTIEKGRPFCLLMTFTDYRDLWGYYFENPVIQEYEPTYESFNEVGWKDIYPSAWSIAAVTLPEGMRIVWEYEPHRYDRVNGVEVHSHAGFPKYGGGARVKKMTVHENMGNSYTRSYFYTDAEGVFEEDWSNQHSSGYASVEPRPIVSYDDYRAEVTRGGLYTPAVVAYEMVQVVENYIEPDDLHPNGVAPNGFTVVKYTHNGDSTVDGFYPNGGRYGQVDQQWKRGLQVSKGVYDSSGQLLVKDSMEYEFNDIHEYTPIQCVDLGHADEQEIIVYGQIKLERKYSFHGSKSGVEMQESSLYADDQVMVAAPDLIETFRKHVDVYEPWEGVDPPPSYTPPWPRVNFGGYTRTKLLGSESGTDYVIVTPMDPGSGFQRARIYVGIDVPSMQTPGPHERWLEAPPGGGVIIDPNCPYVIGVAVTNLSENQDNRDVLVFTATETMLKCKCLVLRNIAVQEINGNNCITWDAMSLPPDSMLFQPPDGTPYFFPNMFVSATLGDYDNNGQPDMVLLEGHSESHGSPEVIRRLFGYKDITESLINEQPHELCVSVQFNNIKGECVSFVDYFEEGIQDDLEVTGQTSLIDGLPGEEPYYPVHRTLFPCITMDMTQNTISPEGNLSIEKDDYFVIGTRTVNNDFRYLGMSEFHTVQQNDENFKVFAIIHPSADVPELHLLHYYTCMDTSDYDGFPNRTWKRNSDSTQLVNVSTPAYWEYPEMDDRETENGPNLITQQCGEIVLNFPKGSDGVEGDLSNNYDKVVSAKATTWDTINSVWLPAANYAWKAPMNGSGFAISESVYTPFDYTRGAVNLSWVQTDSISKYGSRNLPVETMKLTANGSYLYSSSIYGYNGILPVASVTNAQFQECGVFTGDYQSGNNPNYWDYENGWEKGTQNFCQLIAADSDIGNQTHFGNKVIRVETDFAATRNNRIYPGKAYTFSAWAKVAEDTMYLGVNFWYLNEGSEEVWPLQINVDLTSVSAPVVNPVSLSEEECDGEWKLMTLEIPASVTSQLSEDIVWYARTSVGGDPTGPSFTAYIDDIRFAPSDAMITSTYYDQTWQKPIVSIDANNNPGRRVTYDTFGRPVRWEKIDPSQGSVVPARLVQTKEYHFRNELPAGKSIQLLTPDGEKDLLNVDTVEIQWVNVGTQNIVLSMKQKAGGVWPDGWTPITAEPLQNQSDWSSYKWDVTAAGPIEYEYKIKAAIVDGEADSSDYSFVLSGN